MGPGGPGGGWPLAGTLLVAMATSMVAGGEDCLWYVDKNGSWHPGFDCEFFTFCCGTCQQRYCCRDPLRLLTERQQRHCHAFRCHCGGTGGTPGALGARTGRWDWVLGIGTGGLGAEDRDWMLVLSAGTGCWVL
ncbi:protein shisa-4-like, partial [Neopelma chrysocephalum]|uniref:protein shisa-4-like n=1 Tax=Neopelma chrysocephalum TaxID=114329 RepID=UPI000FCD24E7